jgi:hypothetical protein
MSAEPLEVSSSAGVVVVVALGCCGFEAVVRCGQRGTWSAPSRARSKSTTVYCRGSGRVRFFRGPLVVLGTSMAALSCFPVAIVPLNEP